MFLSPCLNSELIALLKKKFKTQVSASVDETSGIIIQFLHCTKSLSDSQEGLRTAKSTATRVYKSHLQNLQRSL